MKGWNSKALTKRAEIAEQQAGLAATGPELLDYFGIRLRDGCYAEWSGDKLVATLNGRTGKVTIEEVKT